ncbi:uncharacterized protein TRIVIDRAFT_224596 [Trichoderma virens Gv29-8]|uniref:Bacteriophage T5 Orf172 DNA-binding domain-containing protein n=1 Tax=Hypocrea virens (strain Gv29-8 / FGSC 10586) TaxID=413071 RepID=G9N0R0_HYPVG|nr:uncharacterized protein TRIVIDRAFT_224596 [Trichoderma virens Gv29-8]EHK19942.1 hypothetical protein TRIVIDRAFT_224596 [Trichoderma virens Gv29-8]
MKTFITYTHCKRWHRQRVLDAFDQWKTERITDGSTSRQRPAVRQGFSSTSRPRPTPSVPSTNSSNIQPITAAALQLVPSTPTRFIPSSASATSDDGSSFVDSIAESHSVTSNTTFASSLPNTPLRNGTRSRFDIEDVTEEESITEDIPEGDVIAEENIDEEAPVPKEVLEQEVLKEVVVAEEVLVAEEVVQDIIVFPDVKQEYGDERMRDLAFTAGIKEDISERQDTIIKGLGVTSIQRSGSIRDHSPVFQVISSHPTADKMREGVVYILQHKENASLFKIGWSSKSAEERLHQPNNCYGINTDIIYETKRFVGAPHAERIAQIILRHANIRVLECFKCQGGHREWFIAPRETVRETVMHVEEFLQMPAYILQDGEYKLSSEAYDHVVKKMCDFSVIRLGELMHARKTPEETETSSDALIENVMTPLAQLTDEPAEISHLNTSNRLSEIQEGNKSFVSTSSRDTKPQQLSAGAKLARKVKRLFSVGDSVKGYLFRPRETKAEPEDDTKRPFGSVFVDLKDKAREAGTKVRHDAREFRRDFKEELRRKSEEQTS